MIQPGGLIVMTNVKLKKNNNKAELFLAFETSVH